MPKKTKSLAQVEREITADPKRRHQVKRHKAAMRAAMRLSEMRERTGASQAELADKLGVTQSRISSLERAEDLQLSTLSRYIEALGGELVVTAKFGRRNVPLSADRR